MHNVYANCVLTIAASWGKDSNTGLFIERQPLNQQPCRIFKNACTGFYIQPNLTDVSRTARHLNAESLEKRAWAVQERFLPARILSYRSFELQWDCLESHASESWPTGLKRRADEWTAKQYEPENTAFRKISLLKTSSGIFDQEFMRAFYSHWDDILQKYTGAQLTYRSDVLIALSGIIETIEKWTGLNSVFGMWKEFLPIDLLWVPVSQSSGAIRSPLCPTRSWASWVGMEVRMSTNLAFDGRYIKARFISLDQPSAACESQSKIKIQGPIFCTKILPSGSDWFSDNYMYPHTLKC